MSGVSRPRLQIWAKLQYVHLYQKRKLQLRLSASLFGALVTMLMIPDWETETEKKTDVIS